jgi:hypothetical protein
MGTRTDGLADVPLRTVAFFDILGFRARLLSTPLLELAHDYEKRIVESHFFNRPYNSSGRIATLFKDHPKDVPWCAQYVFSDSIILVSHEAEIMSCMKLLVYAWRLSQHFMAVGTPLRGGIAYGELYQNPNLNVVVGKALAKAYELEECQNWIGAAIDTSVVERFPDVFEAFDRDEYPVLKDLLFEYAVPMKDGTTRRLKTINWRFNLVAEKGTRSLFSDSNDPKVIEKVRNTLKYVEAFVQRGRIYVKDQSNLPVELRSYYIGGKEPPFDHGDDL